MNRADQSIDDIFCGLPDAYNESLKDDPNDVVARLCKRMTLNKMSRYDECFAQ